MVAEGFDYVHDVRGSTTIIEFQARLTQRIVEVWEGRYPDLNLLIDTEFDAKRLTAQSAHKIEIDFGGMWPEIMRADLVWWPSGAPAK